MMVETSDFPKTKTLVEMLAGGDMRTVVEPTKRYVPR